MQGFIVASNCQVLSVRLCDFVLGPIAGHFKYFKSHDPRKVKRKAGNPKCSFYLSRGFRWFCKQDNNEVVATTTDDTDLFFSMLVKSCLKINKKGSFKFFNFGILYHFCQNWPVWEHCLTARCVRLRSMQNETIFIFFKHCENCKNFDLLSRL